MAERVLWFMAGAVVTFVASVAIGYRLDQRKQVKSDG